MSEYYFNWLEKSTVKTVSNLDLDLSLLNKRFFVLSYIGKKHIKTSFYRVIVCNLAFYLVRFIIFSF